MAARRSTETAKRRPWRIFGRLLALLVAPVLLYLIAALAGGLIPANPDWRQPPEGVTIFVRTNGVHTWVMVPAVTPAMDWRRLVRAEHLADPGRAGDHLAFGWGNREFYLNTPSWGDLSPRTAFHALFGGGPTLMHVDHETRPRPNQYQRPIRLSQAEYRALTRYILASFTLDGRGRAIPLLGRGYGPSDIFYEGKGRYSLFMTSNEWTGAALRKAGVRMGIWTPFAPSIMLRMD
jgi:uncharacterized protein (TIGR02117 family)